MNRDTVKTLAGLLIIGVIVVATFLYGNAQRQSQLKHDAAVKQQQAEVAAGGAKASPSASAAAPAASAAATPATSGQTAANTAPVQSPGSSSLQGGSTATSTPTSTAKPSTPAPTAKPAATPKPSTAPAPVAANAAPAPSVVPQTGGTEAPLPQTGTSAPVAGVVGLAAIATMWLWVRRSKRAVLTAARENR